MDGASNLKRAVASVALLSPKGILYEQAIHLGFKALNNEAEYETLVAWLRIAKFLNIHDLTIHCDSQLVVNQLTGEYVARDKMMQAYLNKVQDMVKS